MLTLVATFRLEMFPAVIVPINYRGYIDVYACVKFVRSVKRAGELSGNSREIIHGQHADWIDRELRIIGAISAEITFSISSRRIVIKYAKIAFAPMLFH